MILTKGAGLNICAEYGCYNKTFKFDKLTPIKEIPLCRKHYRMYVLSWSEYEATKGKKARSGEDEIHH